ncbi:LysE/ArgO family amino acid transporter [Acinetobacter pseudolwoffii]|uniref:LysE/ArgO family amino acid transporter n=1 Tax=Acinetobacter pseudolwoffii TaxID=2053287 RepID=UPI002577430D|nr:LysE/ArgO family amino acid transporter [Acinetobacter pseudolwoffii]MDM1324573.1 amino acid transporter [Acinetobacter pseudolwoffii]
MFSYMVSGFAVGMSLIVSIGAQNAFVLKQGLKQQHIFLVCLTCALSDTILILLGVFGFAHIIEHYPNAVMFSKYIGAGFLFYYGLQHAINAFKSTEVLAPSDQVTAHFLQVLMICLAFTWLNPHVYLETVILIGSISTQYSLEKWWFALGAVCASWFFFFSLGYGAKILTPWFQHRHAWKVLDALIACTMWIVAGSLILSI